MNQSVYGCLVLGVERADVEKLIGCYAFLPNTVMNVESSAAVHDATVSLQLPYDCLELVKTVLATEYGRDDLKPAGGISNHFPV